MERYSLRRRYAATLITNAFGLCRGIVNSILVPLALGPALYGDYRFLNNSFTSIVGFSNLSVSTAFFTASSRDSKDSNATLLFACWLLVQMFILALVVLATVRLGLKRFIFPGQEDIYIGMIAVMGGLTYLSTSFIAFGETKAESVYVQGASLAAGAVQLILTVGLFLRHRLDLRSLIIVNCLAAILTSAAVAGYFALPRIRAMHFSSPDFSRFRETTAYFLGFCTPLVTYEVAGLLFNYFDRWFLQITNGSVEQGLFSVSFQWASVAMLFVHSLYNIAWRELALSHNASDQTRVLRIYMRTQRLALMASCCIAILTAFEGTEMIRLFLGDRYLAAVPILRIMAFFPIFAAIGGVNATFFYATDRVKQYRDIAVVSMIAGIATTYFLVAPKEFILSGLGLGAVGIAWKNIANNMFLAFAQTFVIARCLGFSFFRFLADHLAILAMCTLAGGAAHLASSALSISPLFRLIAFAGLYGVAVAWIVISQPQLCGLSADDLQKVIGRFRLRNAASSLR